VVRQPDDLRLVNPVVRAVDNPGEPEDTTNAIGLRAGVDEDLFDRSESYAKSTQLLFCNARVRELGEADQVIGSSFQPAT
jgi:hypothetical protein